LRRSNNLHKLLYILIQSKKDSIHTISLIVTRRLYQEPKQSMLLSISSTQPQNSSLTVIIKFLLSKNLHLMFLMSWKELSNRSIQMGMDSYLQVNWRHFCRVKTSCLLLMKSITLLVKLISMEMDILTSMNLLERSLIMLLNSNIIKKLCYHKLPIQLSNKNLLLNWSMSLDKHSNRLILTEMAIFLL
jgi:hypothetical protein